LVCDFPMGLLFDAKALDKIPLEDAKRIKQKIDWLWANRGAVNHLPLGENLSGFFKRRIGRYRIIYTYECNPDTMVIRLVGPRDTIYKMRS